MNNKDIIKQYLNTGNRINKHQLNKLNNNLLNTYFRKRLIKIKSIEPIYYKLSDEDIYHSYDDYKVLFMNYEYDKMSDDFLKEVVKLGFYISSIYSRKNVIKDYLKNRIDLFNKTDIHYLENWELDLIFKYGDLVKYLIECGYTLDNKYINKLSNYNKINYYKSIIKHGSFYFRDIKDLVKYPELFKIYVNNLKHFEPINKFYL